MITTSISDKLAMVANLYDNVAESYDSYYSDEYSLIEDKLIQEDLGVMISKNGKLLDIGSGTGLLEDLIYARDNLKSKVDEMVGVDISNKMLQIAINKSCIPNTYYKKQDFMEMDECMKYDYIVSLFSALSYVGVESGLEKIFNLLNTNGRFYVIVYSSNRGYPSYYTEKMKSLYPQWSTWEQMHNIQDKMLNRGLRIYGFGHVKGLYKELGFSDKVFLPLLRDIKNQDRYANCAYFIMTNFDISKKQA